MTRFIRERIVITPKYFNPVASYNSGISWVYKAILYLYQCIMIFFAGWSLTCCVRDSSSSCLWQTFSSWRDCCLFDIFNIPIINILFLYRHKQEQKVRYKLNISHNYHFKLGMVRCFVKLNESKLTKNAFSQFIYKRNIDFLLHFIYV